MSEDENIISQLDTITERFSTPARERELNQGIELYQSCWTNIKNKLSDRTDLDLLRMEKLTLFEQFFSQESRKIKREELQNNARVLKRILETNHTRKNVQNSISSLTTIF